MGLEEIQQVIRDSEDKEVKMKKQTEDEIQDKRQLENELTLAIAQAVEQTINRAIKEAKFEPSLKLQSNRADQRDHAGDQMRVGSRYKGNSVSYNGNGPHTVVLLGNRY